MRLLIRALGSPVPEEVEADSNGTLLDLYQLIQQDTSKISPEVERHRLVRGPCGRTLVATAVARHRPSLDWQGADESKRRWLCLLLLRPCRCTAAGC
jgi:hypothetical protein